MKERPIIMSPESSRAIKEKRKTHTRRVIKPREIERMEYKEHMTWTFNIPQFVALGYCPYGRPGDRLWVREAMREGDDGGWVYAADNEPVGCDRADEGAMIVWVHHKETSMCSSIHMPRWACRLVLEITSIQVERLQDITDEGAKQEGWGGWLNSYVGDEYAGNGPRTWFHKHWDSINAKRGFGWDANPWVWDIGFVEVEQLP